MVEEKKTVIFVCTGNTCRSPMAEAVFRSETKRKKVENVEVFSAGICVDKSENENINPNTALVLKENGLSALNFSPKKLSAENMETAYAIICMTDKQRDMVVDMRWTALREKGLDNFDNNVYSFSDFCGYEIPDPYGGNETVYREVFSAINAAMLPLIQKLFFEIPNKNEEKIQEVEKQVAVGASLSSPTIKKRGRPKKSTMDADALLKKKSSKNQISQKTKNGSKKTKSQNGKKRIQTLEKNK